MIKQRKGRIIFISSVVGLYGSPGQTNYSASKSGLVGLARSISRELGGRGITANVVAPGFIETDMTAELPEDRKKTYLATIPAGRFAQPEEVAAAVRFLAGDDAAYITGAVHPRRRRARHGPLSPRRQPHKTTTAITSNSERHPTCCSRARSS